MTIDATHHFYEELIRLGLGPLMEIDHGWCHSLYYVDPNGIMVEFCRDTPSIEPDHDLARSLLHATSMHAARKVHIR